MKLINGIISLALCTLCVESQTQNRRSKINQDQIYFSDNIPSYTNPGVDQERTTTVFVQKSIESQSEQDSYSAAAKAVPNYGSYPQEPENTIGNPQGKLHSPSLSLQPPTNSNNDPNYYSNNNQDIFIRNGGQIQVPQPNNLSLAITNFGLNLLKNIDNRQKNLVVSPFSIGELLALLQQGALGQTQEQISQALQMTPTTSLETFEKLNNVYQKRNSRNILRIANNVYAADAFELNPSFKRIAMRSFGSEVTPIAFTRSQEAVAKINNWVAQKTNNQIPTLLAEDAVGENTQVVMVNAMYFKGLWAVRFKPDSTLPREFHLNEFAKKSIPFMRIRKYFRVGTDPSNNAQVLILPFENEQYSLMLILPSKTSTLDALVSTITGEKLAAYNHFSPKEVDLEIPKFTARADTDLNPVLKKMGVKNMFGSRAELTGLGMYRTISPQISSAIHSAMMTIDEDGGSASAATSFAVVALSFDDPSITFKANRPFLSVLWDNESAVPLFMAKILDPTA